MIIEHEGKRYEVLFIDYLYGEPGPFGVNSVLHVLRELPAETTITRAEICRGWEVRLGEGYQWVIVLAKRKSTLLVSLHDNPEHGPVEVENKHKFARRPGCPNVLQIIDPPPPAPEFVSTDGRRFTLKEGKLV